MTIEQEITKFKMTLLRKMPFYGDILMQLPFVRNDRISTARTDGGKIEYNSGFLSSLSEGARNYVIMHEVFHVLLFHCKRSLDRDPAIWNTAGDLVVNHMLDRLTGHFRVTGIPFERPPKGIFGNLTDSDTVENVYESLAAYNYPHRLDRKKVYIKRNTFRHKESELVDAPTDLVTNAGDGTTADGSVTADAAGLGVPAAADGISESKLLQIIRDAASANRSDAGSYFIPDALLTLTESKNIPWQSLLRDFLVEEISDESSYTTPERKYLHMDMILPGYSRDRESLEEVWAFVDSSGSVGKDQMEQFITQLYRIVKEFRCVCNICYWDTGVTDVYKKIRKAEDVLKSKPRHSGGTNINCVYQWLTEKNVRPDVMLILTDGYFGPLNNSCFLPTLKKKTILVLSGSVAVNNDMKRIGTITRLS